MSKKKSNKDKINTIAAIVSGRIAGVKIASDECEFYVRVGKNGTRRFTTGGAGGIPLNTVIELLSAAWAGRRKISVQPMSGEGSETSVASVSLGTLPKPPKPPKPAKAAKPGNSLKASDPVAAQPAAVLN